jgi:hypothetical protein
LNWQGLRRKVVYVTRKSNKKFNRAFYYYLKAIQSNPNCHLYYYKLKMILFFSNIFNQSIDPDYLQLGIDLLKQTIEKQPNFLFAQYLLGNLLSQ